MVVVYKEDGRLFRARRQIGDVVEGPAAPAESKHHDRNAVEQDPAASEGIDEGKGGDCEGEVCERYG